MIRNYGDTAYIGTGIINTTAINQIKGQDQPFFPSIFQVEVTNTGTKADSFNITGPASSSPNWRIWYYDSQVQGGHVGGGNIRLIKSPAAVGIPASSSRAQSKDFRFEVGASPLAPADDQMTVQLTATSAADPTKSDVVIGKAFNDPRWELEVRRRNYAQTPAKAAPTCSTSRTTATSPTTTPSRPPAAAPDIPSNTSTPTAVATTSHRRSSPARYRRRPSVSTRSRHRHAGLLAQHLGSNYGFCVAIIVG